MEWVVLVLAVILLVYGIVIFNKLVKSRQMVREGWSGISVQLKRRADLIPNLVEAVKGYAGHERATLEEVVRLRNTAQATGDEHPAERAKAETALSNALGRLFALAESYPDLKASRNFLEFQMALADTENQIQFARRYYNGAVRILNIAVEQFPSNVVARLTAFKPAEYFELENSADRLAPTVSFQR